MVSLTDYPIEMYEALVGKGRITLNSALRQTSGTVKQCLRVYFEFVKEEEDY